MRFRFPRAARLAVLFSFMAAVVVPLAGAGGASTIDSSQAEATATGTWFVELQGAPTAAGGNTTTNKNQKASFRSEAKKAGVSFNERYAFDTLWNGLSIRTNAGAATLQGIKGVQAVYPVLPVSIPETSTISPDLATALAMTGADVAQNELGFTGDGIRVAVMDTGLDYDHADLGGDGTQRSDSAVFPTSRVVTGWDFVGDAFDAFPPNATYNPVPAPDPRPDDCNGHGTHVAGIVGANGAVDGVAPGVTFGAYRVFGCTGSTTADIMIAAMERALADDMDILNMSIGSSFNTWPQYPTAMASDVLVKNGMVVVASIGNSGANGVYSAGAPGVGNDVIGVASYDNTEIRGVPSYTSNPDGVQRGYFTIASVPAPATGTTTAEVVYVGRGCAVAPGTDPVVPVPPGGDPYLADPSGKVALLDRGACTFQEKYARAVAAGATGIVVANNVPGLNAGGGVAPVAGKFAVTTSLADGNALKALITSSPPVTLTFTNALIDIPNPTGGTISAFSSFGLDAELGVKPDLGAPGGLIRSTYPLENGAYATISGTSMASPHVAGAVALLLESNPGIDRRDVRHVLQNSADPSVRFAFPTLTELDPVHRQGAGLLDIDDSILATTLLTPGKISLGEGNGGTARIQLRNSSGSPVTYDVTHEPAAGTTNTNAPVAFSTQYASASFSSSSVTVPGNGVANVFVTITPNAAMPDRGVYGGYVKFTPEGGGQAYRVPYAGFKGDYQSIQVLTATANGFPWLARLTACSLFRPGFLDCFAGGNWSKVPPASNVFTFASAFEQPRFLVHLDHQARSFTVDVYRASDGKWMGTGVHSDYLARSSTAGGFFEFPWDGNAKTGQGQSLGNSGPVADGMYYAKITVMKALGTKDQAETWTSPNFVIDRP